jgi:uncharacterized protein YjbI with pentapeptide repeats
MTSKRCSYEEFLDMLRLHRLWLSTEGRRGERMDLSHANMSCLALDKFVSIDLSRASFKGTDFQASSLHHVDVSYANLVDAINIPVGMYHTAFSDWHGAKVSRLTLTRLDYP